MIPISIPLEEMAAYSNGRVSGMNENLLASLILAAKEMGGDCDGYGGIIIVDMRAFMRPQDIKNIASGLARTKFTLRIRRRLASCIRKFLWEN